MLSFEPFGLVDGSSLIAADIDVGVEPRLFDDFSVLLVGVIELCEGEVFVRIVFLPLLWDFSSSPEPGALDDQVSFITINSHDSESVLSEVVKISNETVLQVAGQITDFSFTFVELIVGFPDAPSFRVVSSPESLEGFLLVFGVNKVSLEIIENEAGFGESIKRIFFLLFLSKEGVNFFFFFVLFLLLLLWLLFLDFLFGLFFLGFFLLFRSVGEVWNKDFLAKPSLSEEIFEVFILHQINKPLSQAWESRSGWFIENPREDISKLNCNNNISN